MKSKAFITCLAILSCLALSVHALNLKSHSTQSHKIQTISDIFHLSDYLSTSSLGLSNDPSKQIGDRFMADNPDIVEAFNNNKSMPSSTNERLRDFINNNQIISSSIIFFLGVYPQVPECIRTLSSCKKQQALKILLNRIDFISIYDKYIQLGVQQKEAKSKSGEEKDRIGIKSFKDTKAWIDQLVQKMIKSLQADSALGSQVGSCLRREYKKIDWYSFLTPSQRQKINQKE